jgi:hypothetical protein
MAIPHSVNSNVNNGVKTYLPHFVSKILLVRGEALINSSKCYWCAIRIQYCAFQAYLACHPLSQALLLDQQEGLAYQILNFDIIAVLFIFWRFNSQSIFRFSSESFNKADPMLKQILSVEARLKLHLLLFICSRLCLHWQNRFLHLETKMATSASAKQILYSSKLELLLQLLIF